MRLEIKGEFKTVHNPIYCIKILFLIILFHVVGEKFLNCTSSCLVNTLISQSNMVYIQRDSKHDIKFMFKLKSIINSLLKCGQISVGEVF